MINESMAEISERELVSQLRGPKPRSDAAFRTLYKAHAPRLLAYCRRMLGNEELARDIFQETFIRFYKKIKTDHPRFSIAGFLITIARNLCFDSMRQKRNFVPFEDYHSLTAPDFESADEQRVQMVIAAMDLLGAKDREILLLRIYEKFSYDEIAEIYNTNPSNARKIFFRAKLKLKEIIEPYYQELED